MPLLIQFHGPYAMPKVFCDYCQEEIVEANDGNYQWSHAGGCAEGQTAPVYFTHKRCCLAFERTHGQDKCWGAIELEALPYYLMKNLRLSEKASRVAGRLMAGLGLR